MKIGANSFIWTDAFGVEHFDVLRKIAEARLDGIEIGVLNPQGFPASKIRAELNRLSLGCTTCCVLPPEASLISSEKESRAKAREHIAACLEATSELGGKIICGPLYAPVGKFTGVRRTDDEWKYAVEGWRELAPLAQKVGVEVAIEPLNRFETYFLNTTADAVKLCDEINSPAVGILLDTFHANIEEKSIGAALKSTGLHLKHVHSCESDRGIPGTGTVHWKEFFQSIKEIGYNRWMVIESFGFSLGMLSAAASIWRDLAATPEDIPFKGAGFIRNGITS